MNSRSMNSRDYEKAAQADLEQAYTHGDPTMTDFYLRQANVHATLAVACAIKEAAV